MTAVQLMEKLVALGIPATDPREAYQDYDIDHDATVLLPRGLFARMISPTNLHLERWDGQVFRTITPFCRSAESLAVAAQYALDHLDDPACTMITRGG